jgi:hypothetical protein
MATSRYVFLLILVLSSSRLVVSIRDYCWFSVCVAFGSQAFFVATSRYMLTYIYKKGLVRIRYNG